MFLESYQINYQLKMQFYKTEKHVFRRPRSLFPNSKKQPISHLRPNAIIKCLPKNIVAY